jgi:glucose/arabinose dehydrogenase
MAGHKTIFGNRLFLVVLLAMLTGLLPVFVAGKPAFGAINDPGFTQSTYAEGLQRPTAMEFAPDGRLFVAEKGGTLRVIKDGQLLEEPFLDISRKTSTAGGHGLLGVTFDPDFATNGYVYVYYTQKASGKGRPHNQLVRFTAEGDKAVDGSEEPILELPGLIKDKHDGGAIHFGNDGKLYVAVGENDREKTAQSLNSLLGKMLRINADGSIPEDNPYYTDPKVTGKNKAIWARGLRNPFSFAVQPSTDPGENKIFINDVGWQRWEEINDGKAGANYGWPRYEGHENNDNYEDPIFAYKHDDLPDTPPATSGCAITGGTFYNPQTATFPLEYVGDYFFADFCNGWIRRLDADGGGVSGFLTDANMPVDLKVSEDGDLYYLELGSGSVKVVQYTG